MKTKSKDKLPLKTQKDRTLHEQNKVQNSCVEIYNKVFGEESEEEEENKEIESLPGELEKESIAQYVYQRLLNIGMEGFYYDNGHPWIIYWSIHALFILDHPDLNLSSPKLLSSILKFLKFCQSPNGGFCGGHLQYPHLASTYAAVLSILEVGLEEGYDMIDRKGMLEFLIGLRSSYRRGKIYKKLAHNNYKFITGSFKMHENGEEDMRGVYIATILVDILNLDPSKVLDGVGDYIASCQTYEGGIASEPFGEAHGGYSFCGFAALCCLKETKKINLNKLIYWAINRQMGIEGGFNGRTNKVVDNCYSFWQGALFKLFNVCSGDQCHWKNKMLYNQIMLQQYCLICCQDRGLIDKPGKNTDLYHTAYGLAGLSLAQRLIGSEDKIHFLGRSRNLLKETDPIFNIEKSKLEKAKSYFKNLEMIK